MRILRIRLRNYRGVVDHEVVIPETGVTVVEGDNEIGKSSLAEALDVLFDFPDSSTNKVVKAIKPVHRDVGSEIEVDVAAGPYRFTYMKRFHREKATTLMVHEPRREQHTGREAHERVQAILAEAVDMPLWRALRLHQGVRPDQADLSEQTSLAAALDAASAGALAGDREATLVELAKAEFDKFFTPGRKLKAEVVELQRAEQAVEARADDLRRRLADLDHDVEHAADLVRRIDSLAGDVREQRERVAAYEQQWRAVDSLLQSLETAKAKAQAAAAEHASAVEDMARRQALVGAVERTERKHRELALEFEARQPALKSAAAALAEVDGRLAGATARGRSAQEALAAAQKDFDVARDALDLATLSERLERVEAAQTALAGLEALLAENPVGPEELEAIEDAHVAVVQERARVEVEGPVVEVEALGAVDVRVGEQVRSLAAGEVALGRSVEIPGVARVSVRGSGEASAQAAALEAAEQQLGALCAAAGVADVVEARATAARRRQAAYERESLTDRMHADLRDLTPERLARKVQGLRIRLAEHAAEPLDFDVARRRQQEAEDEARAALEVLGEVNAEVSVRRKALERLQNDAESAAREVELARRQVESAREDLEAARGRVPDGVLAGRVETAAARVAETEAALAKATAAADKARPDDLKATLDNAKAVLDKLEGERSGAQIELVQVRQRLSLWGEEGLHDRLAEAEAEVEHRRRERASTERRAAAARRLFETLERCRGQARRAYVAPLKAKIDNFGRIVFGEDFSVEVGEDLRILRRTLNGVTVDFEHLSTGAREQLCVISRLACASIVASDGGVPVILDDALGWSDTKRLERLGAVLSVAGQDAQVLVLTCVPERYRHVGAANVVRLTRPAA